MNESDVLPRCCLEIREWFVKGTYPEEDERYFCVHGIVARCDLISSEIVAGDGVRDLEAMFAKSSFILPIRSGVRQR
jgi:hypothetical protein